MSDDIDTERLSDDVEKAIRLALSMKAETMSAKTATLAVLTASATVLKEFVDQWGLDDHGRADLHATLLGWAEQITETP